MRHLIAKRMSRMENSGIRRVFDLAAKLKSPCNLSIGQPDFDTPEPVKQEAIRWIQAGFNKYTQTQGIPELREAVARKLRERNGIVTDAERVLITAGAMGGFYLACCVLFDQGDEVVMLDPYFVAYKHIVSLMGAKPAFVDTYPDFHPKAAAIKKAITGKTKAIIINSPNNPTGHVYRREDLKKVVEIAERNDILVISDEVYEPFVYAGEHVSPGSLSENVLTVNGFSKTASVTGWRIGYATGPKDVMEEMKKLQQYSFVCAPSFAQKAMVSTMGTDISGHVEQYRQRRDRLYEELRSLYPMKKPEGAFYLFPEVRGESGTSFVERAIQRELLVIPGGAFSERDTHFRISYAAPEAQIERGIAVLKELAG